MPDARDIAIRELMRQHDEVLAENESLQARAERAEVALAKYARHLDGCELTTGNFKPYTTTASEAYTTCTCGLRRALEKP